MFVAMSFFNATWIALRRARVIFVITQEVKQAFAAESAIKFRWARNHVGIFAPRKRDVSNKFHWRYCDVRPSRCWFTWDVWSAYINFKILCWVCWLYNLSPVFLIDFTIEANSEVCGSMKKLVSYSAPQHFSILAEVLAGWGADGLTSWQADKLILYFPIL